MNTPPPTIERTYKATIEELWSLWTTREGFQSWWGPQGFRADIHTIEPHPGGTLHYDMVADSPEMIAAMQKLGEPASTSCRGSFTEFHPHHRLALTQRIDFLPGVTPYDSLIEVEFSPQPDNHARMRVTLFPMHDQATTNMQTQGFTSQLSKLDQRYHHQPPA